MYTITSDKTCSKCLEWSPLELANRGIVAEQFVGQQLLYAKPGYLNPELYYWQPRNQKDRLIVRSG